MYKRQILQQLLEQQSRNTKEQLSLQTKQLSQQIKEESRKTEKRLALQTEQTTNQLSQQIQKLSGKTAKQLSLKVEQTKQQIAQQITEYAKRTDERLEQHELRLEQALQQTKKQIQKQHIEIRNEVAIQIEQERTNNKKLFQDCQVETNNKIQDNTDKITELSMNTKQQIVELDERHSNNIQIINKRCEDNTVAIKELRAEKLEEMKKVSENIDCKSEETDLQIRQLQREVRNKLASINNQSCNHNITHERVKNIKYNGTGIFPMELMKEMEDIYMEHYQDNGNVAWIGRHLEGEAAVWRRLIKNGVTNFAEFKDCLLYTSRCV